MIAFPCLGQRRLPLPFFLLREDCLWFTQRNSELAVEGTINKPEDVTGCIMIYFVFLACQLDDSCRSSFRCLFILLVVCILCCMYVW